MGPLFCLPHRLLVSGNNGNTCGGPGRREVAWGAGGWGWQGTTAAGTFESQFSGRRHVLDLIGFSEPLWVGSALVVQTREPPGELSERGKSLSWIWKGTKGFGSE